MNWKNFFITLATLVCIIAIILIILWVINYVNYNAIENIKKDVSEKKKEDLTVNTIDYEKIAQEQMEKPKKGEVIAVMHIKDLGDIKLKFFKEDAPKAVENFIEHAKHGYYNGLTFHRVINGFMIQGGDPTGTGRGGESIWKEPFKKEVTTKRFPFRGTICMASVQGIDASLGSQFFITQAKADSKDVLKLKQESESLSDAYAKFGGVPSLFLGYTVFGQVYEGMDVVDKIAAVNTNAKDKPLNDVIIDNIEVKEA